MLKKLTGIFILLCFFLVKSTSLFAVDQHQPSNIACCAEQGADETPDAEKESKQLEISDEDFMQETIAVPLCLMLPKNPVPFNAPDITAPYISLPYPPPNGCLL